MVEALQRVPIPLPQSRIHQKNWVSAPVILGGTRDAQEGCVATTDSIPSRRAALWVGPSNSSIPYASSAFVQARPIQFSPSIENPLKMKTSHRTALLFATLGFLALPSINASAQPLSKNLNTGDGILRGNRDWVTQQTQKQVAQNRSGNFDQITGQQTLAREKNGNIFFVATREDAEKASNTSAHALGSGDIFGKALRQVNSTKLARR
jgi:hypothetical protein